MNYLDEAVTKSLDEFMEYYKVVDTEEIYSNGIELAPIFRVKQWEEYNSKNKEIERLNNIINGMEKFFQYAYDNEVRELNDRKVSVWTICLDKLQELKGEDKE